MAQRVLSFRAPPSKRHSFCLLPPPVAQIAPHATRIAAQVGVAADADVLDLVQVRAALVYASQCLVASICGLECTHLLHSGSSMRLEDSL